MSIENQVPVIPPEENIPAETIQKPELDGVFISHLRYQDQTGDSKACTVTCHYMNTESREKDYASKAYTLRTGDMDALMTEVPEVAHAFGVFTTALTSALPAWIANNQVEEEEEVEEEVES